ncbi:MAG: hypothetical protein M3T55_07850 [Pseudomonadota bacterium]|nr:hypothetical protein [Pseudomonadota bacterium]
MGEVNVAASPRVTSGRGELADILRRREVRRVVYFHCDHFEPWRPVPGSRTLEENAADVLRFADASAANEFSRRLTLFYKCQVGVTRNVTSPGVSAIAPDDVFGFAPRTAGQEALFAGAMRGLMGRVDHEIQVHIHHEHHTYNTSHRDPQVIEMFRRPEIRARDAARFELHLNLSLDAIRQETGLTLDRWFFVHGVWALNASDPTVCHITDEIAILMRNGCLGDFTFPAGRPNVDPVLEQPYFALPLNAPQSYVLREAEPERAFGNPDAAARKFFIWASNIRHMGSSLDYFAQHVDEKLKEPRLFAAEVLQRSYVVDGTLYFKTHSHSMHTQYWRSDEPVVHPHQHPAVRALMGAVFDAATRAGAGVEFLTASEVYDEFVQPRPAPPEGFALKAPYGLLGSATIEPVLGDAPPRVRLSHADEVDAACTAVLREALARDGPTAPGVGEYYQRRAERGEVLMPYETRIAQALLQEAPFTSIYEIGSGVSALPFFLSLNGARSVGVERDMSRVNLGRTILERLSAEHPELPKLCELRRASAPEMFRDLEVGDCAAVFTNVTGSISPDDLDEVIRQLAGFRAVIVDLSRFFEIRDKAEQAALLDRLMRAGCGAPAPLATPGDTYWMFRRESALDPDDD